MKTETIAFLEGYDAEHATPDSQLSFMLSEMDDEDVAAKFGAVYGQREYFGHDQREVISGIVESCRPKWIIAVGNSATIALGMRHQRKILLNPSVGFGDLNNVPEFDRQFTFGFFDKDHEADYERFQTVYPNSAWYGGTHGLRLRQIEGMVSAIIEEYS